jgi:5-(carboxyamino)imidazole ribonucleotide mutase
MPSGVPVATVALNGAENAGILAVQILATNDKALQDRMIAYKESLATKVEASRKEINS